MLVIGLHKGSLMPRLQAVVYLGNLGSIHCLCMCQRLVEFVLNLTVKKLASIVRLSCVQLAESTTFANFLPKVVVLLLVKEA